MKEENKKTEIKRCELCNAEFVINSRNKREKNKRFCTQKCAKTNNGKSNIGRKHSLATKEKIKKNTTGENNHFFGKSHTIISKNKMSKSSQWNKSKFRYCNLKNEEKEILDGLMLSDGCLSEKSRISARITFGFKFKETCVEIINSINSINFSPIWQSKKNKCWYTKSNMYHDLLKENNRWYPESKKIVPENVLITSLSCYWWFLGDGYISEGNVYLCTDSFTENENLFLISKLKEKGYNPSLTNKNRIRFNKKESIEFLHWIKPENGILEQYKYKWKL